MGHNVEVGPSSLTYVAERGEGVADVSDRVVGEGEEGVVGGEGVPPGGEGGFPRPVPEHSHALALSPETHTKSDTLSDDTFTTFTANTARLIFHFTLKSN